MSVTKVTLKENTKLLILSAGVVLSNLKKTFQKRDHVRSYQTWLCQIVKEEFVLLRAFLPVLFPVICGHILFADVAGHGPNIDAAAELPERIDDLR